MASCTSSGRATLLFSFCILVIFHLYQLHRFYHLVPAEAEVINNGYQHEPSQSQLLERESPAAHGEIERDYSVDDDPSFRFEDVFGSTSTGSETNQSTTAIQVNNNSPPPIELWLLHPTKLEETDHASLQRIARIINRMYFQKDGQFQQEAPPLLVSSPNNKRDSNQVEEKKKKGRIDPITHNFLGAQSLRQAHHSWLLKNPSYTIRYYNLHSARRYLHKHFHAIFLRTFDCIQAFAGKSDFFRMVLLWREGGFHADWKMECLEYGLLDSIANMTDFFAAVDMGNPHSKLLHKRKQACAQNSFVGSTPRHPILATYLKIAMNNVQQGYYPVSRKPNPLSLTGPCAFGKAVRAVKKNFGREISNNEWPIHDKNHFYWNGREIILAKCQFCGGGQNWSQGNNYNTLVKNRTYYCEDSASIFLE